jgi:hypothetical protein
MAYKMYEWLQTHPAQLTLPDVSGRIVFFGQAVNNGYIHIKSLPGGMYIAVLSTDKGGRQVKRSL